MTFEIPESKVFFKKKIEWISVRCLLLSNIVPPNVHFPQEEEKILKFWEEIDAFQTSLKLSEGRPPFSFYDGPPFATGLPHYGHLLAGTIKVRLYIYIYVCIYIYEFKHFLNVN
jgi:hypothetical protein